MTFDKCVRLGTDLAEVLKGVSELLSSPPHHDTVYRLREIVSATILYRKVEVFSHGGKRDITNNVFAPTRLLLSAGLIPNDPEWTAKAMRVLDSFRTDVIAKCRDAFGMEAHLKAAFSEVEDMFVRGTPIRDWRSAAGQQLDNLMALLTECRSLAGATSQAVNSEPEIARSLGRETDNYRLLIIDDHGASWRPVFKVLREKMKTTGGADNGISVRFEFWTSDSKSKQSLERLLADLPQYDAVLLDVFLSPTLDGLQILRTLRKHYINLPVIIWTTSQAIELPAEAYLAHGFLFKKTTTLDQMAEVLSARLTEGNAKRRYALPGHFFDHSIRKEKNRKCALKFTDYCSKQLDGFHALDDQYFRYFTDHGGRHLLKLLEYLGDILRPVINNHEVFSSDDCEREEEILSLYLSVFLHEFGMIRLKGKNEPEWGQLLGSGTTKARLTWQELALVRTFHSLRGMVLLTDRKRVHWPDEEGQYQARKRLFGKVPSQYVRCAVAFITGYHSRLLPLDKNRFGIWDKDLTELIAVKATTALGYNNSNQFDKRAALKLLSKRFYGPRTVKKTLAHLTRNIRGCRLERVRKHCAIFRFVDAIDVDYTRNPAEFLCLNDNVSPSDRREILKRQVVSQIRAEGGTVHVEVCVPFPYHKTLARVLGPKYPPLSKMGNPWQRFSDVNQIARTSDSHKQLDQWLANFWNHPGSTALPGLLDRNANGILNFRSKIEIASLTALAVAWEIMDEYQAIVKCDMQGIIKLGKFGWRRKDRPHSTQELRRILTMLFHHKGVDKFCKT